MPRFADVRFVYFDLDDTLLDHRSAERAALAEMHGAHAAFSTIELDRFRHVYHDVNVQVWHEYGAGRLSKDEARSVRFARLGRALGVDGPDPEALGHEYLDRYSGHWRMLPGASDAFRWVSRRFPVGILTNGFAEIQRAKFGRFPELVALATAIVISEEVGVMKPDPRLFDHAARKAATAPGDILYVGDSLHSDVEGGLSAGWQVAWFGGSADTAPARVYVFDQWQHLCSELEASGGR